MTDRDQSIEMLIEFTKDGDAKTRAMALAGLAKARDARGFAPTLVALFDPEDAVRAAAATALGIFGDDRAFEPLMQGLDDPSAVVAANCVWSLGQILSVRCLKAVFGIAADPDARIELRRAAATAIGERSAIAGSDLACSDALIEQARARLLEALGGYDDELRAACVWSLGHLPADEQTTRTCIDLLNDEYEWTVRYAIEALAHFGDASALQPLEKIASGQDDERRSLAEEAINMLQGQGQGQGLQGTQSS